MKIRVENAKENGRCLTTTYDIPDYLIPTNTDDMWDYLWQWTGDGTGENLFASYIVTILDSPKPALIGLTYEWN
jgi:hypothetical protein